VHVSGHGKNVDPDFLVFEIYIDNGNNLPGDKIHEEAYLLPYGGDLTKDLHTIPLSKPVKLTGGKYWFSFYGTYLVDIDEEIFFVTSMLDEIGDTFVRLDEPNEWETFITSEGEKSMYFRVQGYKETEILYNVYRDNELIAPEITEISYTDNDFDPCFPHTWKIKVVCPEGGESAATIKSMPACKTPCDGVKEHETTSFTIAPNPAYNEIKVSAKATFSTIEVINFLGQTVISQPNVGNMLETTLDISNLNSGIYFVRIATAQGMSIQKFIKK
jgi:hypothetical protein